MNQHKDQERRQFVRLDYASPLAYKICKKETIFKLLEGYTSNISKSGVLCTIKDKVHKDDIVWLCFDRSTLSICREIEQRSWVYQNGIIGKVTRVEHKHDNAYSVGVRFITREEKGDTHILPPIHFNREPQEDLENEDDEAGESAQNSDTERECGIGEDDLKEPKERDNAQNDEEDK